MLKFKELSDKPIEGFNIWGAQRYQWSFVISKGQGTGEYSGYRYSWKNRVLPGSKTHYAPDRFETQGEAEAACETQLRRLLGFH